MASFKNQANNRPAMSLPAPRVRNRTRLSAYDLDILTRTVIGEANGESRIGKAAVAHVIRNRTLDRRWPNTPAGVALQPKQFSTWNRGVGGNHLPRKYNPGDRIYDETSKIVQAVFSGEITDPTGAAVYYYAPQGMPGGRAPRWWATATRESGGVVRIGNHRFAGDPNKAGAFRQGTFEDGTGAVGVSAGGVGSSGDGVTGSSDDNSITRAERSLLEMFTLSRRNREKRQEFLVNGFDTDGGMV